MKPTTHSLAPFRRRGGSALIIALIVLTLLTAMIGAGFAYTDQVRRLGHRNQNLAATQAAAEGGLEYVFYAWRQWIRQNYGTRLPTREDFISQLPQDTPSDLHFLPPQGSDPTAPNYHAGLDGFAITRLQIDPLDENGAPVASDDDRPYLQISNVPDRPGIRGVSALYEVTARARRETLTGPLEVSIQRAIQQTKIPLFQFAIFYDDILEIHPGPGFDLNGLVHTNGQLYTAHNTLRINGYATMGDTWENNFAPGDPRRGNQNPTMPQFDQGEPQQVPTYNVMDVPAELLFDESDSNPNNDGYRELIEVPDADYEDPEEIAQRRFYNQAGLKILLDSTTDPPGLVVKRGDGSTVEPGSALYGEVADALSSGNFRDNREQSQVYVTNVDIQKLNEALALMPRDEDPAAGFNGVVYIADTGANADGSPSATPEGGSMKKGIRLQNGSVLPDGGLTIATDNPVYVQGDYNTGATGANVPSNRANNPDFTQPSAQNYDRESRPAAILADAVMVLSNAWSDANSSLGLSNRVAANTTINAAILSGIVPTNDGGNGRYSGGAENFPRFLERWSNVNFTYYGSMIQLFRSEQFDNPWLGTGSSANVYDAPRRRWFFETGFLAESPPGTLEAVVYSRGQWTLLQRGPATP